MKIFLCSFLVIISGIIGGCNEAEKERKPNIIIIFTSDNGPWLAYGDHGGSAYPLREGKGTCWEGGQREPCIIRYPETLKPGRTITTPIMAIDILPTIAALTDSKLPEKKIDGKNVWDILTGNTIESPHKAYFFYYNVNELHGVRYKNWKMYFPHEYQSLNGRPGGKNGMPSAYDRNTINQIELYNLSEDISETINVAKENPEVVEKIILLANDMREELGDALTDVQGKGTRTIGKAE